MTARSHSRTRSRQKRRAERTRRSEARPTSRPSRWGAGPSLATYLKDNPPPEETQ